MENQMEIKSTNEIAGNIFGKVYFKCPFCNSEKVQDKPEERRWYCHKCKKYFLEPITLMDERIPLDKIWVSVDSILKELEALEPVGGSDVDFPFIYELICHLKNYESKDSSLNKDLEVSASPTPKESQKAIPSLNPDIKLNRRICSQ